MTWRGKQQRHFMASPPDPITGIQKQVGCTHDITVVPHDLGYEISHDHGPSVFRVDFKDRVNGYREAFKAWLEYLHAEV